MLHICLFLTSFVKKKVKIKDIFVDLKQENHIQEQSILCKMCYGKNY